MNAGNCFQDAYSSILKSVLLNIAPFHDTDVLTIFFFGVLGWICGVSHSWFKQSKRRCCKRHPGNHQEGQRRRENLVESIWASHAWNWGKLLIYIIHCKAFHGSSFSDAKLEISTWNLVGIKQCRLPQYRTWRIIINFKTEAWSTLLYTSCMLMTLKFKVFV